MNHILLLTSFLAGSTAHAARVCFSTQRSFCHIHICSWPFDSHSLKRWEDICEHPVLVGVFCSGNRYVWFSFLNRNLRCWLFSQVNIVTSNFWSSAALFLWILSRTLMCGFCCRDLKNSCYSNSYKSCYVNYSRRLRVFFGNSAFKFRLSVNGRFEERNSWFFDEKYLCMG